MVDIRHMHTDLVRTAGFQAQAQTGMGAEMFHNAVMGHRRFAHWVHGHVSTFGGVASNRLLHRAPRSHGADRYRFVLTGDLTLLQCLNQAGLRRNGFGNHHQAGGIFVQTVNYTGTRYVGNLREIM
ncbi:hypothetical protein D3C75_955860 [compost metagenome]